MDLKKLGFTLAEVLITLGIIGIVAEMTIPTLMNNVNSQVLKVGLKKSFSTLSQATMSLMTDNNGSLVGVCATAYDNNCARNVFAPYLRITKSCDQGTNGCFWGGGQFKNLNGTSVGWWGVDASVVLSDGSLVDFYWTSPTCVDTNWGLTNDCGYLVVDVNGVKLPNQMGKDVFFYHLQPDGIKPFGIPGDRDQNDCVTAPPTGVGMGCAYKVLYGN